jgi:hypothetical protein
LHVEPSTFPAYEFTGYSIDGKPACPFFKELLQRFRPLRDCFCRDVPDVCVAEPPFGGRHATAVWRLERSLLQGAESSPARSTQVIDCRTWWRKSLPLCPATLFGFFGYKWHFLLHPPLPWVIQRNEVVQIFWNIVYPFPPEGKL